MKISRIITKVLAIVAMLAVCASATALDLKTKKVKGVEYYYYKVKKGESLYGISKSLGISVEDIVTANPFAVDGVRKGDILLFPVEAPEVPEPEVEDSVATEEQTVIPAKRPAIAVLLPFGLNKPEPSRLNKLALDFYKGVLIAADSLRERKGSVEIIARDTEGLSESALAELLTSDPALSSAAVYIGPEDAASLDVIAAAANANRSYVLNVLNIRDTTYRSNPYMLQANAPQIIMYGLAVDGLMADYPGYRPVILKSTTGKNEKSGFTEYLTERYQAEGIEPAVIEYETNLLSADIETLPCSNGEKYVYVPSSGSLNEFNRFAHVLRSYRDRLKALAAEAYDTAAENGEQVAPFAMAEVFGYPDWTAFRGDALDMLHRLNATVYSRFFDDFSGFSSRSLNTVFKKWFGTGIIESIPSYGLLGYDAATYLIRNLNINEGRFDPEYPAEFAGVQSTFQFKRAGEGFENSSIYIINYQNGGTISVRAQ